MKTITQSLCWVLVSVFLWNFAGVARTEETGGVEYRLDTGDMNLIWRVEEFYEIPGSQLQGKKIVEKQVILLPQEIQKLLIEPWNDMLNLEFAGRDAASTGKLLGLDAPTRDKIRKAMDEVNQRFHSYALRLKNEDLSNRESRKIAGDLAEFMKDSYQELTDESQREKLKQLAVLLAIQADGLVGGLTKGIMRERFSVSERQAEEMRTLLPQVDKELRAEILKMVHRYREQLLKDGLSESQLEKLNQLRGELIDDAKLPATAQALDGFILSAVEAARAPFEPAEKNGREVNEMHTKAEQIPVPDIQIVGFFPNGDGFVGFQKYKDGDSFTRPIPTRYAARLNVMYLEYSKALNAVKSHPDDLEVSKRQLREIADFEAHLAKRMLEIAPQLSQPGDHEALVDEILASFDSFKTEILFKHQLKRIGEIQVQEDLSYFGSASLSTKYRHELGMTDQQIATLSKRLQELQEQFFVELSQLLKKQEAKLLEPLGARQRKEILEALNLIPRRVDVKDPNTRLDAQLILGL